METRNGRSGPTRCMCIPSNRRSAIAIEAPVLIVADINTLWRSCPFQALSGLRPVLGLAPMDPLVAMRQQESVVVQNAKHSFFVSEALRDRAVKEYAIDPARGSVSMNATGEEFLAPVSDLEIDRLLSRFRKLTRPIAGVIGGISDRLDFDLIEKVAES